MNLFEPAAAREILTRMEGIKPHTPAACGKMNAAQMMAQCQAPFKAYFGEIKMRRALVGIFLAR